MKQSIRMTLCLAFLVFAGCSEPNLAEPGPNGDNDGFGSDPESPLLNSTKFHYVKNLTVHGVGTPMGWEPVQAHPVIFNNNCLGIDNFTEAKITELKVELERGDGTGLHEDWRLGLFTRSSEYWVEVRGPLPLQLSVDIIENPLPQSSNFSLKAYAIPSYVTGGVQVQEALQLTVTGSAVYPEEFNIEVDRSASCA